MENHEQMPWHSKTIKEVLEKFNSSNDGLSDTEAEERLKNNGFNELRKKPRKTIAQMLLAQIIDPMVLILIVASIFSIILKQWTEGAVILFIVVLNAIIGVIQEKKAE